jgi:salicylate 5-hydroxylase small subunit
LEPDQRAAVDALMAEYGAALDEARYADWLNLYDDEASYVLQPRENFDRELPLATMRLESRGMLEDRIYGIENTLFHQPYYQRHVIGVSRTAAMPLAVPGQVAPEDDPSSYGGKLFGAQCSYAVFRTRAGGLSEVFNVGRYLMQLLETHDGLRLRRMHVVFDSELVPNSVIYPI